MATLYVSEPGSVLRRTHEAFEVTLDESGAARQTLATIPRHALEVVVLVGPVHVTAPALEACLAEGLALTYMDQAGRFRGRLVPPACRTADLRIEQFRRCLDPAATVDQARRFLDGKFENQSAVLAGFRSNHPGLDEVAVALERLADRRRSLHDAVDPDTLFGIEGSAAADYFHALRHAFVAELRFNGRQQRPAPDPVNALLSLGYVVLGNRLADLLEARGFDPVVGFLHQPHSGRCSLALDLLEEFRPAVVDRFVLRLCNLRMLQPRHFEADPDRPGGVRLTRDAYRRYFAKWEKFLLRPIRDVDGDDLPVMPVVRRQLERLAAAVRGRVPYEPLRLAAGNTSLAEET